jgi:hypothetical protein
MKRFIGISLLVVAALGAQAQTKINPNQIKWPTGSTGCVYSPPTNTCVPNGAGSGGLAGVNVKTASYTAVSGDNGKLIVFNCASACSLTLPSTSPSSTWAIDVQNIGIVPLGITVPGSLTLDGVLGAAQMNPAMGSWIWTDGTNYFTERGAVLTRSNAAPVVVQSNQNNCGSGPCGTPLPNPVSAGSALIFTCDHGSSGNCNATPTDLQGDTFILTNTQDVVGNFEIDSFVACNAVGGPTTITSASGGTIQAAYEVANVAVSSCVDAYNSGQNTTNNATQATGSVATTLAYDFIFVEGATRTGLGGSTMTEANGYTGWVSSGLIASALTYNSWYGLEPGAGSVSDTVSYSPTGGGEYAGIIALKPLASSAAIGQGDLIVGGPDGQLQALHPGTTGDVLTSNGPGGMPSYQPGAGGSGALTKIAQTVLSSPTSTITFSAIPGSYATLELIVSGGSASGSNDELVISFNSDGAAHYSFQCMEFYPSTTITTLDHSGSASYLAISGSGQSGAGINAFADIKIMNYTSASGNNGVVSTFAYNNFGIGQAGGSCGGSWFGGTAAITSISVKTQSGSNLPSGTTATLYGLN